MSVHLFDGTSAGNFNTGSTLTPSYAAGVRFTVSEDTPINGLRAYHRDVGQAIDSVDLWSAAGGGVLVAAFPGWTTNPNTAGVWWEAYLAAPVTLHPGIDYRVVTSIPSGGHFADISDANMGIPPGPFAWASGNKGCYVTPAGGYPTNTQPGGHGADIIIGTPASNPPGGAATSQDFYNWLSNDPEVQKHAADSLPWEINERSKTIATDTASTNTQANDWAFGLGAAAHGYYADIKTLIGNIKTVTDTLPTPIAQLTSIVLDHYTADIAGILAQIDSVLSNLGAQSTDLSGTAGSAVGALSGRTGFPATGWTMSAEADFEDAIAFAEVADAYVLSITSYQDTQPANASPAGLWLPRLGWWCVLNGTLASQRQFVDFEQMLLTEQGRRMPGCAIQLRPGTLATVQAWLLA